jgi:hypothetical protein
MLTVITRAGRLLIAVVFAMALAFGATQLVAASVSPPCDTPPDTCTENEDCFAACLMYNMTEFGGGCIPSQGCCICLE